MDDVELQFYDKFFFSKGNDPYPIQEKALGIIFAGKSCLITVPTGTGKTAIAKGAIYRALAFGQTAIYTTPLRALTEEKFRELSEDFGPENVGFSTGDYSANPKAPIQVTVAEILWNRVFSNRGKAPADVVVMDEAHYFNDYERGYVWEQTIIGLHPTTQLVMLSATVGNADRFCHWAELTRRVPMKLVESRHQRVPLHHEYREEYLLEVVKDLAAKGNVPAIVFVFGREKCFETALILKSCRRFTSDEEKERIEAYCKRILWNEGVSDELRALLVHGIGVHHAGILPRYKELVEQLALERLLKFVVSTETIAAGINLPAKRVVFPSVRKYIRREARLLTPAEFHQMAGRAGRPQFDTEGVAITLAPEDVVQDMRWEISQAKKRGRTVDEAKVRKSAYARAKSDALRRGDVSWDQAGHQRLIDGEPAQLHSQTRVTAEQVLAIGLPDLESVVLPGEQSISSEDDDGDTHSQTLTSTELNYDTPPSMNLDVMTVIDNLLVGDRDRRRAHVLLAQVTANLQALGVIDEHGRQVAGELIGQVQGLDGPFLYHLFMEHQLDYEQARELVEFLVDHNVIHRALAKKDLAKKKEWIRTRLRELRRDNPQVAWEDVEAEYDRAFAPEPTWTEKRFSEFCSTVRHPELHGGKVQKNIWAQIEEGEFDFFSFVDTHRLAREEGNLFSYLARVMKAAKLIAEATGLVEFGDLEARVRAFLGRIEPRVLSE